MSSSRYRKCGTFPIWVKLSFQHLFEDWRGGFRLAFGCGWRSRQKSSLSGGVQANRGDQIGREKDKKEPWDEIVGQDDAQFVLGKIRTTKQKVLVEALTSPPAFYKLITSDDNDIHSIRVVSKDMLEVVFNNIAECDPFKWTITFSLLVSRLVGQDWSYTKASNNLNRNRYSILTRTPLCMLEARSTCFAPGELPWSIYQRVRDWLCYHGICSCWTQELWVSNKERKSEM